MQQEEMMWGSGPLQPIGVQPVIGDNVEVCGADDTATLEMNLVTRVFFYHVYL